MGREVRKKERETDRRKRGCSTGSATHGEARKDEEKGEENNSAYGKNGTRVRHSGGKFSIKLHRNGGWLTRGVGWTDERMDGHGTAGCADCNSNRGRVQASAKVRGETRRVLRRAQAKRRVISVLNVSFARWIFFFFIFKGGKS